MSFIMLRTTVTGRLIGTDGDTGSTSPATCASAGWLLSQWGSEAWSLQLRCAGACSCSMMIPLLASFVMEKVQEGGATRACAEEAKPCCSADVACLGSGCSDAVDNNEESAGASAAAVDDVACSLVHFDCR